MSRLSMNENGGQEEAIERLLLSLSVVGRTSASEAYFLDTILQKAPHTGETSGLDMVVASMDVNGMTRAAAVQTMLRTLRESPALDSETLVGTLSLVLRKHTSISFTGILAFRVLCTRT
jgi:hypothetical protein